MTSDLDEAIGILRDMHGFMPHALWEKTAALLARYPKLLPCPHCGGKPIHSCSYGKRRVECAGCGAKVTREEISTVDGSAIAAWNRRTP